VDIANEVVKALAGGTKLADLKITYLKEAEKVDSVSCDAIEFTHPAITKLGAEEKVGLQKLLGDTKIRFLVAAPDGKTVVMTIGGGTAMMSEALKLAKGGGTIPKDAGVVEALKSMPANPEMVMVISAGNAIAVVKKAAEALDLPLPDALSAITAKTPIAFGGGVSGDSVRAVFFIPNDLVKEIVVLWKKAAEETERLYRGARGAGGTVPTPPKIRGGESF
jgi:hypothetical protein